MIRVYCLPVKLVQEGDDGDGKEPKPEEEIELLVHNVVRKNAHSVKVCLMAPTAKLYKEGKWMKEYGEGFNLNLTCLKLHEVTIGNVRANGL